MLSDDGFVLIRGKKFLLLKHIMGFGFWLSFIFLLFSGWLYAQSQLTAISNPILLFVILACLLTTGFATGWLILLEYNKL